MKFTEGRRLGGRLARRVSVMIAVGAMLAAGVVASPVVAAEDGSDSPEFGLPDEVSPPSVIVGPATWFVNFQGVNSPLVAGWSPDTGLAFDDVRGYGWRELDGSIPESRQCGHRNAHADPVLDSFCHAQSRYEFIDGVWRLDRSPAIWEAAVPDGSYEVTVTMGEALHVSSSVQNSASVEGVLVVDGFSPTKRERHRSSTIIVDVEDGFVTVDPSRGARGRITSVRIVPHLGEEITPPDPVLVSFQPAGSSIDTGWLADSGRSYSSDAGFGWRAKDGGVPPDRQCGARDVLANSVLDTFCHAQTTYLFADGVWTGVDSPAVWELAVTNGTYDVTVVMGESKYSFPAVVNSLAVESIVIIDGFVANDEHRQVQITVTVTVDDGFLTLDPSIGRNGKLASVVVEPRIADDSSS